MDPGITYKDGPVKEKLKERPERKGKHKYIYVCNLVTYVTCVTPCCYNGYIRMSRKRADTGNRRKCVPK